MRGNTSAYRQRDRRRRFAQPPFSVRHSLVDHPLLSLDAIAELADEMPRAAAERHRGDLPMHMPGGAPELDGTPSDTVRGLETNGNWMVLWNIEQVPRYKALLDACLDEVEGYVGDKHGGMRHRKAYLFLSAPGATTPAHFDPEQNLLLQIRGAKDFSAGRFPQRSEQQAELDRYFDGGHRNLDRMPELVETFHMDPGDGVYVPPFMPHWVHVGDQASISLSITFRTRASLETERVSHFNARMRRLQLSTHPPGGSPSRDRLKASVIETLGALRRHRGDAEHGDPGGN